MEAIKIGNVGLNPQLATLSEDDFIKRVGKQLDKAPVFAMRTEKQRIDWLKAAYKTVKEATGTNTPAPITPTATGNTKPKDENKGDK